MEAARRPQAWLPLYVLELHWFSLASMALVGSVAA